MAITATNEGSSNYAPVNAGTYAARCFSMVHIGTINENIQGKDKVLNKVRISWELPTELKEFKEGDGEKPYVVHKEFTLSMNEKATLRKFLESWRGKQFTDDEAKSFDITVLLGKPCMLSVIHKISGQNKTYADISMVTGVPKGMTVPEQVNPNYEFNYDNFSETEFAKLPSFIQDKMKLSLEYAALKPRFTQDEIDQMQGEEHEKIIQANGEINNNDLPF